MAVWRKLPLGISHILYVQCDASTINKEKARYVLYNFCRGIYGTARYSRWSF
jgi:hypothetical protein